jgi:hypothetical protein
MYAKRLLLLRDRVSPFRACTLRFIYEYDRTRHLLATRTVRPSGLQSGPLLQEETMRSLEHHIPQNRGEAFELWRQHILVRCVEGRASSRVVGVERQDVFDFRGGSTRNVISLEVCDQLLVGSAIR